MRHTLSFNTCLLLLMVAATASAAAPTMMNYQGTLTTSGGIPVPDGSYSVIFSIYFEPMGSEAFWAETLSVATTTGLFTVNLGSTIPLTDSAFFFSTAYLGIKVGDDPEISPRTRLVTSPYAFRVSTIDGAKGGYISRNIILESSTSTSGNIFKGGSLFMHNFGSSNTFVGSDAGNLTMSGGGNTGSGSNALFSNAAGNSNTANGAHALSYNTDGSGNTATGVTALFSNTTGSNNTASGLAALYFNSTGDDNTAGGLMPSLAGC